MTTPANEHASKRLGLIILVEIGLGGPSRKKILPESLAYERVFRM
jgi:hypothetical protein